ncbi:MULTISPECIES: SPOR domain-containing protein [Donghicola]|jgi:hypothetical protein|uniref:Putative sporulation protein n=1 Tax=Donghicola eburneus TaxID=393278 RepID=A0A1M4N5J2_9RHOB|nr:MULTISPECIES: SPOR domain-containing protein [Donghicola]MCT4577335.1 SPOR domain-containing protein [Donghicola sp.]SCM68346.1 putative sporulation protein [Donghicola eburneus]SFQ22173.1 Sporulation related domain-containing protein [Donghicola eburneus]
MADYQSSQGGYTPYNQYGGNYGWDDPADYMQDFVVEDSPRRKLINIVGSVASVAVVSAVVLWGYGTIVRDVSGIPVVAAMEGPVRVAPADPGGEQAENLGLAVNEVVAAGANNAPVEQVVLAPEQLDVAAEDAPLSEIMPVEPVPAESTEFAENDSDVLVDEANIPVPLDNVVDTEDDFAALANQLALAVKPQETLMLDDVADSAVVALRPQIRPFPAGDSVQVASASDDFVASITSPATELDATALPAGTRLVQLGAYESPEIARVEWTRISGQFAEFFDGKSRVIQKAESGGRIFYRLRVHGFDDLADSRRFCSVLVAGNAACIPIALR